MDTQGDIGNALTRLKIMAPAGYAMALHIQFNAPAYLFQTYPKEWTDYYSQNGLVMRDPTVHWGFEHTGTILWSDLLPRDDAGVIALAAQRGISNGFTYALDRGNSRSVTSFAKGPAAFTPAEMETITGLVDQIHDQTANGESLTPGTREHLRQMSISFTHPTSTQPKV
jgi:LuxR family transcriptional regulator